MCLKQRITRSAFERSSARRQKETRSILMRSAEFWFVQYCFVAKLSVGYVNTRDDHNSKRQHVYEAKAICWSKLLELKMCYLYFFCLHCLINIHIFDYPDSRLSGLFTLVPPSPDNRGSTVLKRMQELLPFETRRDLYKAIILPHFNYCSETWHFRNKKTAGKLEVVNKRALRFVFRDKSSPYEELCKRIRLSSLRGKRLTRCCPLFSRYQPAMQDLQAYVIFQLSA